MDFFKIVEKHSKSNNRDEDILVYPDWINGLSEDLVIKGGAMYAYWNGEKWVRDLDQLIHDVDNEIHARVEELRRKYPDKKIVGHYMRSDESGRYAKFDRYSKIKPNNDVIFNKRILFANDVMKREDYATNQLTYSPEEGETVAYDELMDVLYAPEEQEKILWFMGALLSNRVGNIQKFLYLYGGKGSGKGTVLKVFKMLFDGYYESISLAHLTSDSEFATSQVKEVPLLIDEDSDMSRIRNDTNLLKMTAHEPLTVNAKYRQTYEVVFNGLLVTASNQRYKVRNVDSGITRRAVVASPTSNTIASKKYFELMSRIKYEIPAIAFKAIALFDRLGEYYYEDYVDLSMAEATDHIFSFVREHAVVLGDTVTLKQASELFKLYLDDIGYDTNGYKRIIKNELMRYYREFHHQKKIDGEKVNNVFIGLKRDLIFPGETLQEKETINAVGEGLDLTAKESIFDEIAKDYPAQLATENGTPKVSWDKNELTLKDIDTKELHFVRVPMNHIVIDFDIKDIYGEKDLSKNLIAAAKFPPTYTELSKSGKGVHLHYLYDGDVSTLAKLYEDDVEIKVFVGKSSLRRKLTKCNDLPIARITTGLPMKEEGVKVYKDVEIITWTEKKMRTAIEGNLKKKYHASTKPSMSFIAHIFEQAEKDGLKYDLRDMRQDILLFALGSTNNSQYCMKLANSINYCTIDEEVIEELQETEVSHKWNGIVPDEDIWFYDVEIFPNLFVVAFKRYHDDSSRTVWINPTRNQIEGLLAKPLAAYNCRRYDNHIMYNALMGASVSDLYRQSQRIINTKNNRSAGMFGAAYELSYVDIYEYVTKKQSLKKWEIELGITHDEMELPWDQPVPEHLWERVGEYCLNDVDASEAVFDATYADYNARKIISTLSGLSMNATTQQHAERFLFGTDKRPQDKFIYTDLSETFPGYKFEFGKSSYRGEDPGEGGYVHAEPGVYEDVDLFDIVSMHPTSLVELNYFGPYTERFKQLLDARVAIKHGEFDKARKMFNGELAQFLDDESQAKALSFALKIIINIVYGMSSASFDNKFKHPDNVDNIVAKRGALFMINLKNEVQSRGFTVAHIKTDSIKIPGATPELIEFLMEYARQYGYEFEHENTYSKFALVNKAVYISQYQDKKGFDVWEPIGAQFADPYVFKRLFSKETVLEEDYAVTKQAKSPIYLGERFVGKVARVYASLSGDDMFRVDGEKKSHVTGTKGYKWKLFSEYTGVSDIDMKYYDELVLDAVDAIKKVGDHTIILDPFDPVQPVDKEKVEIPF